MGVSVDHPGILSLCLSIMCMLSLSACGQNVLYHDLDLTLIWYSTSS